MIRGNREIAEVGEVIATARCVAIDARDNRLRMIDDLRAEFVVQPVQPTRGFPLDVATGAEGTLTGAGDDDDADAVVLRGLRERG